MADLTTLEVVKTYLGVPGSADDDYLSGLITGYSDMVRQYTGRDFTPQDYTRSFDGRNTARLVLPQTPVTAVASVTVDGAPLPAQAMPGQLGYRFDQSSVILDGWRFNRGWGNVSVSWTAGFATIPPSIAQALNEIIGAKYKSRATQGIASKSLAGETITFSQRDMPASAKLALDQFDIP